MDENNPIVNSNDSNITQDPTPPTPQWYDNVDPSLLTDKVKGFKDLGALVKSYNESQSFIGKGIPDDNTPADIRDAFYAKLGRPESADKYEWQPPEGLSVEGATADNFKAFKQKCFDAGLTDKQVSTVMGGWSDIVLGIISDRQSFLNNIASESKATLSAPNEWGDKYEERLTAVHKRFDDLKITEKLALAGLLYDTETLKAFDSLISGAKETKIRGVDGKFISPNERLAQLKSHPAYFNAGHPEHAAIIAEANAIFAKLGGAQ